MCPTIYNKYTKKEDLQIYNFFTFKVVGSTTQNSPILTEYVTPLITVGVKKDLVQKNVGPKNFLHENVGLKNDHSLLVPSYWITVYPEATDHTVSC